jgi:hypothetical protein
MMEVIVSVLLCIVFVMHGCISPKTQVVPNSSQQSKENLSASTGISSDEAIAIANNDAKEEHVSLIGFPVVVCEQSVFWRIIYDKGGPEYVIDKQSGTIIRKQKVPQGTEEIVATGDRAKVRTIGKDEAISVAKTDAYASYGQYMNLDQAVVVACEQERVWRVIYDYRLEPSENVQDLPNGAYPKYVIDKAGGRILYREMN